MCICINWYDRYNDDMITPYLCTDKGRHELF